MGAKTKTPSYRTVAYLYLICFTFAFWAASIAIVDSKKRGYFTERVYKNLHALEYPSTAHDLSIVSFSTPAMPSRLASTWEVRDALRLPASVMSTASFMIYPMMERTLGMAEFLQAREKTNNVSCVACQAQTVFDFNNVLVEDQMQHYCPKRGETQADWAKRTGQSDSTNIESSYKTYSTFHYNNEHSQLCRASRSPSMVLAHVASSTFTLFSSQNSVILLLYIATVNTMFGCSIFLYRWHGSRLSNSNTEDKMELHGLFSFLFFVSALLWLIPAFADYYERNDGPDKAGNRAIGSYVLGVWTVVFAFIYIKFFPMMVPWKEDDESREDLQKMHEMETAKKSPNGQSGEGTPHIPVGQSDQQFVFAVEVPNGPAITPDSNKEVVMRFIANQPMISFAYWSLAQVPCCVMLALTEASYGVDSNTQLVIIGAFSIALLDVVHARVIVILSVLRKTADLNSKYLRWFVELVFLFLNWCITIPVLSTLYQTNMGGMKMALVLFLFWSQTFQNIALTVLETMDTVKTQKIDEYTRKYELVFLLGLVWQTVVSVSAMFAVY